MTKKLVLGNHLVPEILAHLGKLAPLPADGLLAGQALASAILDLYAAGGGVYNDIDIFLPATPKKLAELASDERKTADALALGIPVAQLDDYGQMNLESRDGLHMAGSDTEGLLNLIWCNVETEELTPGKLAYSFDLNAVEVVLDLRHKELTWSRAFEEFLESRQLEITSLATPERTLLRYLKKRQELAVFGQDELVLDMVATWMSSRETPAPGPVLTTKALSLARQFAPQLSQHFQLKEGRLQVLWDWLPPEELQSSLDMNLSDSVSAAGVTRMVPAMWYTNSRAASLPVQAYAETLAEFVEENAEAADGMVNVMRLAAKMHGASYVRGQRSATHRDTVLRVLDAHPGLNAALMGLTLDEQYRCVLDLAKRAKSLAGPLVYGLAETMATPVDMWNAHHREQFFRVMAREVPGGELCPPCFTALDDGLWTVRELRTTSALRAEGIEMSHCVGGYAGALKSRRSRILSLRHAKQPKWAATAELQGSFQAGGQVRIAQHRTYLNRQVAKETQDMLERYLKDQAATLGFTLGWKKPQAAPDWLDQPA